MGGIRRAGQQGGGGQTGAGFVRAQGVRASDRAGVGRDVRGIQFLQLGDVRQNAGELEAVAFQFFVGEGEPRQVGDVFDVFAGECHAGNYKGGNPYEKK